VSEHIDYYLSLSSPWSYLGHARFVDLARRAEKIINIIPVEMGAVFAETGGLPLPQRSAQRRAYRLIELARWRDYLKIALVPEPKFFPVKDALAAGMVWALKAEHPEKAIKLAGLALKAVWADEGDIEDPTLLAELAAAVDVDAKTLLGDVVQNRAAAQRAEASRQAIERGVFGAPTYVYDDEPFWGQDRLDLLAHKLGVPPGP